MLEKAHRCVVGRGRGALRGAAPGSCVATPCGGQSSTRQAGRTNRLAAGEQARRLPEANEAPAIANVRHTRCRIDGRRIPLPYRAPHATTPFRQRTCHPVRRLGGSPSSPSSPNAPTPQCPPAGDLAASLPAVPSPCAPTPADRLLAASPPCPAAVVAACCHQHRPGIGLGSTGDHISTSPWVCLQPDRPRNQSHWCPRRKFMLAHGKVLCTAKMTRRCRLSRKAQAIHKPC